MAELRPLDDVAEVAEAPVVAAAPGAPGAPLGAGRGLGGLRGRTRRPGRRARRGVAFWLAVGWLGTVLFCAVFATWLPVADPVAPEISAKLEGPSLEHPLGADGLGRDQLSRLVHGARVSLVVSLTAVGIGALVGGTLGTTVGFVRGRAETVVMAAVDVMLAFPGLVLLLVVLAYVGRSLTTISLVIGFLSIPVYTRVARANTLAVAQREFVHAAHVLGARRRRILFREIVPNVALPVAAFALVAMGIIIVLEGALAFLGLSVEPPDPTWGGMISDSKRHMSTAAHVALVPSAAMFLTVLSLNFVGDVLRRSLDPKDTNV
jgi:peptide/nickel transport system permease protein